MRMTVIPIVTGILGIISKGLKSGLEELEIRGQIETIQTKALLKLARTGVGKLWPADRMRPTALFCVTHRSL